MTSGRILLPRRAALLALPALLTAGRTSAQPAFPSRPITLVVPFAPGGIADLTARAVADAMGPLLGQAIVVDNRPGPGSIAASQAVMAAKPDGHTLLLMSNGHAVSASLFKRLPYDATKDFAPVSTLGFFDLGFFVAADSPFRTLPALLVHARANPGRLNVATVSPGSTQHLAAKLFETMAGVEWLVVPYKGTPAVLTALRSGEVQLAVEIAGPVLPQVAAGAVRALAVSSAGPNPALPGVPPVAQSGVPGYDVASWNALAAPAGTPPAVVDRLNRAVRQAVAAPAVRERLGRLGVRLAAGSPAELQALLAAETLRWGAVIRAAKIEPE